MSLTPRGYYQAVFTFRPDGMVAHLPDDELTVLPARQREKLGRACQRIRLTQSSRN